MMVLHNSILLVHTFFHKDLQILPTDFIYYLILFPYHRFTELSWNSDI
jgi:hypothetical protein